MKFTEDLDKSKNSITGYEANTIHVNHKIITQSLILAPDALVLLGDSSLRHLNSTQIEQAKALTPEVILIGTGKSQHMLSKDLLKQLVMLGIGYEVMTTKAACRTYNILLSEDRRAVAILLLDE
ncbi:MAG: hypothetical protein KAH22_10940 [Thiotrichaceae bacterium]|nr:hypothetical protein [Thiotrichaceae bacterium]